MMNNSLEIDWDEIKNEIKEAKEKCCHHFHLVNYGLIEIPTEIFNLESLRELDLRHNRIKNISPKISNLTNLRCLDMESNQIETIDESLAQLIVSQLCPSLVVTCT
ncbi:MAG: leucine-rich repeat domain-containing protein [Cyanobacteria bacterium P01_A01_bin.68]